MEGDSVLRQPAPDLRAPVAELWAQVAALPAELKAVLLGIVTMVVVVGALLVGKSWTAPPASATRASRSAAQADAPAVGEAAPLAKGQTSALRQPVSLSTPGEALGRASLALTNGLPLDEADNLRWALVRRHALAGEVYDGQRGVDWEALRQVVAEGDILVPAGFTWSFNETFQQGPGYKQASGILAGGHCALATVFNAAARAAGLPTAYRQHRTPFPGYPLDQSVNIYWGRDDLRVENTTGADLELRWQLDAGAVTVHVLPLPDGARTPLPSLEGATIALTYGRPRSGKWGSLGLTDIVDHGIHAASQFAARVDGWNGDRPTVVAVNPNVVMAGASPLDRAYVQHLIAEAERRGAYVMLDVQTGGKDPLALFRGLMDLYLRPNVWFDWDVEHTDGGRVSAAQLNQVAAEYFRRRAEAGYVQPGLFAFYIFDLSAVPDAGALQYAYDGGQVVPIFDGYGARNAKLAKTTEFRRLFDGAAVGIMEFETRWGTKYDGLTAQEYLTAFPDVLIYASQ